MNEAPRTEEHAEPDMPSPDAAASPPPRRSRARRFGCGVALLFWFMVLSTPCALFYLAANGEIRLEHRDIPQAHLHPFLLVSLVSEADDRGLRIERSWLTYSQSDENMRCVETAVRFLLWEYSGGNQNVNYCDCYTRQDALSSWEFDRTYSAPC